MKKRALSLLLAVALAVGLGVTAPRAAGAASYDPEKAVEYAAAHWNDGKGFCAEFASDCMRTAGLTSWSTSSTKLFHLLCKEVVAESQIATVQLLTVTDRRIRPADNQGKLAKGDIVFFQCDHCAHCMHTLIVSDVSGENAKCYQHNPRVNNKDIKIDPCYQCGREYSNIIAIHFETDPGGQLLAGVLSVPSGIGYVLAKPAAISCLDGIAYSGDRAVIAMTQPQAQALAGQLAVCVATTSGASEAMVYAALFDTGAGIPGLFVVKGYGPTDGAGSFQMGEAALWSFEGGSLVPFAPVQERDAVTLFPAYVHTSAITDNGSRRTERYYARGYGRLYPNHACVLTTVSGEDYLLYGANGLGVTEKGYQELTAAYQGSGRTAAAGPGGTGYHITGMTPATQVIDALEDYMTALVTPIAYPSTQSVEIDGRKVELLCYALKDEKRNDTNYVQVRDLADALNGTAAQFEVGWEEGSVIITTQTAYTPNGTEGSTPYSGNQVYETVENVTRIDGEPAALAAFRLKDKTGGWYTYYPLRDLGKALGFRVDWSAEKGIFIETE